MSWEKVMLGSVAETCLGKMLDRNKNRGSYHPYLANINVRWGSFDLENLQEMRFEADENERYGLNYGDLVICEGGEPGRCALWRNQIPNMKIQKALHRVRVNDEMDSRYVYYWFLLAGRRGALQQYYTGATIMHMTGQKLRTVIIDKPPLDIQTKISDYLESFDDLIENNQKQIKLLEEAAQRLYKEWFIDLRFPGHENGESVDAIPLEWYEDTIDTKVNLLNGFAFKSKDLEESGLFKLVTIKNVQDGYFEGKNVKYLSKIPDKMPRHCYLNEGDLLLSLTGNVGRVCIVEGNDFLLNQRVAKISSETPAYTYCLFRSDELFIKINNIANGAAQQNVSSIRIGKIKHLFPNDKLIMDFERVAGPILKRVVLMKKNIILLEEARDRLLPKLMSGELEV